MNKGISYTLRFRSTMEIDGAIYTSPNTFFIKKKKKKNRTRRYQCCNRTRIEEDRKWKMFSRLWGLLHHDYKLVKYFIFFQRIGDYLFAKRMRLSFLGWKKPRLWGWNILIYVKDYLNLWNWFFQFYYNTNLVTLSL